MANNQEHIPLQLSELKPNMELVGTVSKVELSGAFVDVGAKEHGFVHLSKLRRGNVNRVEDVVQVGQSVQVWVRSVDSERGRLQLTMVRPVDLRWRDIRPGMHVKGRIIRVENFGAFVDIGAARPGLVHVSEMKSDYVRDPNEIVQVEDEVDVVILEVDRKKRQIRLSMKQIEPDEAPADDPVDERLPTAMELAIREAMEAARVEEGQDSRRQSEKPSSDRKDQDELLQRTLEQRVRTS